MTIKELENRCGLDRATIRFYEKEGLIAPKRLSNGYRDYSEDDALTLEKISLLRRLDLSLEDIRLVQSGEVPLGIALERHQDALADKQRDTARAIEISRAIRTEGVSYQTLQPGKYKAQLPPPSQTYLIREPEEPAAERAAGHPWRRYLARHLDTSMYGLISAAVLMLLLRISPQSNAFALLEGILTAAIFLGLEPLLLSTWGYTPGKWLLGLRLRDYRGRKLDYFEGLDRSSDLFYRGMGLSIPIANLICMYKSYKRTQPREDTLPPTPPQDQPWDELTEYTVESRSRSRYLAYCLVYILVIGLLCGIMLLAAKPNLLGRELTREQYVKNVNHVLDFGMEKNQFVLDNDGCWTADGLMSYVTHTDPDSFRQWITETDGHVTSVIMSYPIYDPEDLAVCGDGAFYKNATVFALLGKAPNKKDKEQLTELYQMGEGVLELEGWVLEQSIDDKPSNFTTLFKCVNGMWYWMGGEKNSLPQTPRIRFQMTRK